MHKSGWFFLLLLCCTITAQSQVPLYEPQYRPKGITWKELISPHFRVIFPSGYDSVAFTAARLLEHEYPQTQELTGGRLKHFPVILTNYNDLSNGFVTPINFRSEVDLAPLKGKSLNPQSGSWLESVLPHELVHATHANNIPSFSLARFVKLFSPDIARTFNFFPPLGVHEGLAVYYESTHGVHPQSGRYHYPYFTNQFAANISGKRPWSFSQTLTSSDYTFPWNRHYLGGAHFTAWLHQTYGERISRKIIERHQRLFFLGYGFALKQETGKWPGALFRDYQNDLTNKEAARISELGSSTDAYQEIIIPGSRNKVIQRRPIWINNSQLLFYSQQYNAPSAFYVFDVESKKTRKLAEAFPVQDFYVSYNPTNQSLLYAEYFRLSQNANAYQTDIVSLNVEGGNKHVLTSQKRLFSPQHLSNGKMLALRTSGTQAQLVLVDADTVIVLSSFSSSTHPVTIQVNPKHQNEVAVLLNKRGVQGIWLCQLNNIEHCFNKHPDVALQNASIHDPVWHRSGERMLFSSDVQTAMNVYEWDLKTRTVVQLTNSLFNAFEADYAPNDAGIVYVTQQNDEQQIAYLDSVYFLNKKVPYRNWIHSEHIEQQLNTPFLGNSYSTADSSWVVSDYTFRFSWLKPRAVFPLINMQNDAYELGAFITGTDPLQSQQYSLSVTTFQSQLWFDAFYSNKSFYPGFELSLYRNPELQTFFFQDAGIFSEFITEERGISLRLPFEWYHPDATRFTSLQFVPELFAEQIQFWDLSPSHISPTETQYKVGLFTQFNWKLLQLPRDVQPSSGFLAYAKFQHALNSISPSLWFIGNEYRFSSEKRYGYLIGVNTYLPVFQKWNHSLKVSAQLLSQSDMLLYNTNSILPLGFNDPAYETSSKLSKISTRYVVPLVYPDNGGLLFPFYLSSVYLSAFTHTISDYSTAPIFSDPRTILGAGIHLQFKISNLGFEVGAGFVYDPAAQTIKFIIGSF